MNATTLSKLFVPLSLALAALGGCAQTGEMRSTAARSGDRRPASGSHAEGAGRLRGAGVRERIRAAAHAADRAQRRSLNAGKPTGEYVDFMTGFMLDNDTAWGRPAGLAVTPDGALLVSDDANGTIFRVTRK
jgi:hypothetical protein